MVEEMNCKTFLSCYGLWEWLLVIPVAKVKLHRTHRNIQEVEIELQQDQMLAFI